MSYTFIDIMIEYWTSDRSCDYGVHSQVNDET